MKMIFYYHANKTNFHKKGFALGLIVRVRVFGTLKWPIARVLRARAMCSLSVMQTKTLQSPISQRAENCYKYCIGTLCNLLYRLSSELVGGKWMLEQKMSLKRKTNVIAVMQIPTEK